MPKTTGASAKCSVKRHYSLRQQQLEAKYVVINSANSKERYKTHTHTHTLAHRSMINIIHSSR